jgi:hypothetical protein
LLKRNNKHSLQHFNDLQDAIWEEVSQP